MTKKKPTYRVRNWSKYNKSLVKRGSLTVWVSPDVLAAWTTVPPSGKRGHPQTYRAVAIESMATWRAVYHLAQRATQGWLASIFELRRVTVPGPSDRTLSRRQQTLDIHLPKRKPGEGVHLVVDRTGVKVFGEGEWKVRQHGYTKRRTWKKLPVGVDETTGDILARSVTDHSVADHEERPGLLDQIDEPLQQVSADGAYDKRNAYDAIRDRDALAPLPPRRGARIWQPANSKHDRLSRDENLRAIRKHGRKAWKHTSGYHRRSLAETTMSRFKRILGPTISARTFASQTTQIKGRCKILNTMTQLGTPDSYLAV